MEKETKAYLARVRRYLNLPRDRKDQVIRELTDSIMERRAQGMTDADILRELGAPKLVAAEWNERLKEFACRKSPWRFVFLAAGCYGALELLGLLAVKLLYLFMSNPLSEASSIGIIGGADGPTVIFVATSGRLPAVGYMVLLLVGILGYLRLCRCKQKT